MWLFSIRARDFTYAAVGGGAVGSQPRLSPASSQTYFTSGLQSKAPAPSFSHFPSARRF